MQNDICIGCKRTKDEIKNWSTFSDKERETIIENLKDRTNESKS